MSADPTAFHRAVAHVVASRNCSGCGACAAISPSVSMTIAPDGFLVPTADPTITPAADALQRFTAACPGVEVRAPSKPSGGVDHPIFGPYLALWRAWAVDPQIRWTGSSGGVLTALNDWLLRTGQIAEGIAVSGSAQEPLRTVPVHVRERADALASAGSRYAPVGTVSLLDLGRPPGSFTGKPCEAYATRRLIEGRDPDTAPVILSFFCAGVPSQRATEGLVTALGLPIEEVNQLAYRGGGCPGTFSVGTSTGAAAQMSYAESWGGHLGRTTHDRCKICPDATGMHADVAVGDLWQVDAAGFPSFEEAEGVCVAIGRTARGRDLLLEAQRAGVIVLEPLDPAEVVAAQPSQVRRVEELAGRVAGRRLAGADVPRYRGFGLLARALRDPATTFRALRGSYARTRRGR